MKRREPPTLPPLLQAAALDPTSMVYLNNMAAAHFGLHQYDECVAQCKKAIEIGRANRADFKASKKRAEPRSPPFRGHSPHGDARGAAAGPGQGVRAHGQRAGARRPALP